MRKFCFIITYLLFIQTFAQQQQIGIVLRHMDDPTQGALNKYIDRFQQSPCKYISEFNIISNIPLSTEIIHLQNASRSIPIHFKFLQQTQTLFKFRVSEESTAQMYYIGNIDSEDTCEDIQRYMEFSQLQASAGIIPLIGQFQHTSVITIDNSQKIMTRIVNYGHRSNLNHFQIVQNLRIFSKHTIMIALSKIKEVERMRKATLPICEQIFLNFIAAHFYPELRSRIYKFAANLPPVDFLKQTETKGKCIRQFISILGYSPLFYQKKVFNHKIWKNPHLDQVIQLKKVALNSYIINESQRLLIQSKSVYDQSLSSNQKIIIFSLSLVIFLLLILLIRIKAKIKTLQLPPQGQSHTVHTIYVA